MRDLRQERHMVIRQWELQKEIQCGKQQEKSRILCFITIKFDRATEE